MKKIFLFMLAAFMLASCDSFKGSNTKDDDTEEEDSPKKKKKKSADEEDDEEEDDVIKKKKKSDDEGDEESSEDDDTDLADDDENMDEDEDMDNEDSKGWTNKERTAFQSECVNEAARKIGAATAKTYCNCMLKKIEAKFSSYDDANKKMTKTDLDAMAADCNRQ